MLEEILKSLGLNEKETTIYLTLLPLGSAPASVLGQRTKITRSTAQYTCQQLVKKGLLRSIEKNNTFIYAPEPPDKLLYLLDQEKKTLAHKEDQVHRIIGDLKSMINPQAVLPKVRFFEGVESMIQMLDDVLKENKPLYGALQINEDMHPEIFNYAWNIYTPKRKELKNPAWILLNDTPATREYRKNDAEVNRVSLLVPEEIFPFDACCHIYGNKVAFYSYKKTDVTGVLIENTFIHGTQFSLFKLAWNYAKALKINKDYQGKKLD